MQLRETLKLAWENRTQIANGFYNTYLSHKPEIDTEIARRKTICESNVCGKYDAIGIPETSAIPGQPSCSVCHCNIKLKTACTYCWCALKDLGQEPLWDKLMEKDQDDNINAQNYENQFKLKQ